MVVAHRRRGDDVGQPVRIFVGPSGPRAVFEQQIDQVVELVDREAVRFGRLAVFVAFVVVAALESRRVGVGQPAKARLVDAADQRLATGLQAAADDPGEGEGGRIGRTAGGGKRCGQHGEFSLGGTAHA